jgi:hypothetical protein
MTTPEDARWAAAFELSRSGKGVRLADTQQLKEFADFARDHEAVVSNVESYEVQGEAEVARIDLSIYGEREQQALTDAQRVELSWSDLQGLAADIEAEGIACVFQVWAHQLTDGT